MSFVIADKEVYNEVLLFSEPKRKTHEISFAQVMNNEERKIKGDVLKFSNLRNALEKVYSNKDNSLDLDEDLLDFLVQNNCGIWSPYSLDRYSEDNHFFTITGHPIDETIPESQGYIFNGNSIIEVMVNEDYADKYPVLVITPDYFDYEFPDNDYIDNGTSNPDNGSKNATAANHDHEVVTLKNIKLKTVWNTWFWTKTFRIHVLRGEGAYDPQNNTLVGTFPTDIVIVLPRSYAKDKKWYPLNIEWDTKWNNEKTRQVVGVYRERTSVTYTIKGTVGYKKDPLTSEITASAEIKPKGNGLGVNEWVRDWFYNTNHLQDTYQENRIRSTSNVFDMTFSITQY